MPSKTFNNLSKEKKIKIMKAATDEFSKYTLMEASINRIIKDAGIARGSFYMYFKDIHDIYQYVIDVYIKKIYDVFKEYLSINEGDMFDSFINLYDYLIKTGSTEANHDFCHNMFMNINLKSIGDYVNSFDEEEKKNLCSLVNKDNINVTLNEEVFDTLEMLLSITLNHVVMVILFEEDKKVVKEKLIRNFDLLKKGINNK